MDTIKVLKKIRKKVLKNYHDYLDYGSKFKIEGAIENKAKMLYVLAGYKPYLWEDVLSRVKAYQPEDMEVCIASSGKYCEELSDICKKNGWIYLSTKLNNVCVMTNIIMREFPKAEYIFKIDEDIFLPKDYFGKMLSAYGIIEKTDYEIGYIFPTMPLGVYAMHEFLVENNCLDEYEAQFGKHIIGGTVVNPILRERKGVDEYIWSKIGNFDKCAQEYAERPFSYEIAGIRPSIAAILFRRKFWDDMGQLHRGIFNIGVGDAGDEGLMTKYCALNYRACFQIKNIFVGHFAFGGAEQNVMKFKEKHEDFFKYKQE